MTGIEVIVNQILDEAKDKEQEILAQAEEEILEISQQAKVQVEKYENDLHNKLEKEIENYRSVAVLMAEQKKKRALLEAKQQYIENVLNKAYEKMVNADGKTYFENVLKLVRKYALGEKGEIIFNKKDLERMPGDLMEKIMAAAAEKGGSLELSKDSRNIESGFVLVYGGIEENCTFKALLDIEREKLHDLVNKMVFC